jgi:nicotinate-nucleotide adenylyltransferase
MKRVAFFGGTFDPIHRGHLRVAAAAAEAFGLDRVLFVPVGHQPLKAEAAAASFADRLAMVRLAIASYGKPVPEGCEFLISTLDQPRHDGRPNYTVDTLAALAAEYPGSSLFVLTGADSLLDLPRWHSPVQLLRMAEWIVVSRPDFPITAARLASLGLSPAQRERVHLLNTVHEDVSATELRRRLHLGDPCTSLLPEAVTAYIRANHLYR